MGETTIMPSTHYHSLVELEENLKTKMSFRKFGFVFGLVVILSLLISATAYAKTGEPIVELFRLGGTQVGIKITFPDSISGGFVGMLNGKSLDCTTVPSNVVYCMGPFQKSAGPSTFFLIDQSTKETVLKHIVVPPKPENTNDDEPLPTETPFPCGSSATACFSQ
jgi:hypothetical protein